MTIEEYITKQQKRINQVRIKAYKIAVFDTHRVMANRIFNEGEAANESLIGSYNTTKPLYINPKNAPRSFPTGGKTGNKRNGGRHKTAFFNSYRDFKRTIGQPTDRVRLKLFGRMQSDFVTGIRKVSNVEYTTSFKDKINLKKSRGQEARFGKAIFKFGDTEIKNMDRVMRLEVNRILYGK